jgi:hypothetical protein
MPILRNDQTIDQLKSEFQETYDSSFAWESAISAYLGLPFLRGFWPTSAVSSTGALIDLAGDKNPSAQGGANCTIWGNSVPCVDLESGSSQYYYRADAADFDILGTETYIASGRRGLTCGAWVQLEDLGTTKGVISKYDETTCAQDGSYLLYITSSNEARFLVSGDGSTSYTTTIATPTLASGDWNFIAGRFDPSTEIKVWLNEDTNVNTTSIPASIHNSATSFLLGAYTTAAGTVGAFFDGKMSMMFLCAGYLEDAIVRRLYYRTRPMFQSRNKW